MMGVQRTWLLFWVWVVLFGSESCSNAQPTQCPTELDQRRVLHVLSSSQLIPGQDLNVTWSLDDHFQPPPITMNLLRYHISLWVMNGGPVMSPVPYLTDITDGKDIVSQERQVSYLWHVPSRLKDLVGGTHLGNPYRWRLIVTAQSGNPTFAILPYDPVRFGEQDVQLVHSVQK